MKKSILKDRGFAFLISAVKGYQLVLPDSNEFVHFKQIPSLGACVGVPPKALIKAASRKDSMYKSEKGFTTLLNDSTKLIKLFTASLTTARKVGAA